MDVVLDKAGQKGTGRWTAQVALELGVAIPTIAAAIDARVLSSLKDERGAAAAVLEGPAPAIATDDRPATLLRDLHDALFASRICAYAQGMALIARRVAQVHEWRDRPRRGLPHLEGRLHHPGASARSAARAAFCADPQLPNLLARA